MRQQAYIDGQWIDAKEGAVIRVTSTHPLPSLHHPPFQLIATTSGQTQPQQKISGQCRSWG